eukprot:04693.XXX_14606_14713_1 [CDS] Oithona nana genome sequencing.
MWHSFFHKIMEYVPSIISGIGILCSIEFVGNYFPL